VVVGGPLIWSAWHPEAIGFVTHQQRALSQLPVAYCFTALQLLKTAATQVASVPVYLDPALATPPKRANRLSFTERYATVDHYLAPALHKAPLVKPCSVGFFGGKLGYRTLTLPKHCSPRWSSANPATFAIGRPSAPGWPRSVRCSWPRSRPRTPRRGCVGLTSER
jgi:hypothetical protein